MLATKNVIVRGSGAQQFFGIWYSKTFAASRIQPCLTLVAVAVLTMTYGSPLLSRNRAVVTSVLSPTRTNLGTLISHNIYKPHLKVPRLSLPLST